MDNAQAAIDSDIYLKIGDAVVQIIWSWSDPPYDPSSAGVIGVSIYGTDGEEYSCDMDIEGGELDTDNDAPLAEHIPEVLDFIGAPKADYEIISEEDFDEIVCGSDDLEA